MDRIVHLSFGDFPGRVYAMQLFADLLIHGWDLSVATGQDIRLDPELVDACAAWFADWADGYREFGAVADPPPVGPDAGAAGTAARRVRSRALLGGPLTGCRARPARTCLRQDRADRHRVSY